MDSQLEMFDYIDDAPVTTDSEPKKSRKAASRQRRREEKTKKAVAKTPKGISPRNEYQAEYIRAIKNNALIFGVGDAGVGKTFVACAVLAEMLLDGQLENLYIVRPTIAKKEHKNGFLPGTMEEKQGPWLIPIIDGLKYVLGSQKYADFFKRGVIQFAPFEHMRGRTFSNAGIILDEAQNCSLSDLQLFLTRQGENLKAVVCGDPDQTDIEDSGLSTVVHMVSKYAIADTSVIYFPDDAIVRSEQTKSWVKAFKAEKNTVKERVSEGFNGHAPNFMNRQMSGGLMLCNQRER